MDPGIIAAFVGVLGAAVIASVGGTLKLAQRKADRLSTAADKLAAVNAAKLRDRDRKIELLEQAADKQDDVIAELRSQRDRLQITAELQDRFFGQLGPKRRDSGD